MITLSTGLPGAGKTLYTIAFVKELAERESRPVFYSGIKDLALPWHEIEAENWNDCPEGAIIVIDECQRLFRPRGNGAQVPPYVSALETHRHKGMDIFIVTQHPMLIDANVRRLTERHFHVARRFGMQRATVLKFESCKDQPLAKTAGATREEWKYPKEVFNFYKSAEVHTVKRRIPMTFWVMLGVPVLVGALIYYFINRHYQDGKILLPGMTPESQSSTQQKTGASPGQKSDKPKALTRDDYIRAYSPRIEGLAYSAPIYDEVTKPVRAPVPVGTVIFKGKCSAYSQQGTPLNMPQSLCLQIAAHGFFREFDDKNERQGQAAASVSAPPAPAARDDKPINAVKFEYRGTWVDELPGGTHNWAGPLSETKKAGT